MDNMMEPCGWEEFDHHMGTNLYQFDRNIKNEKKGTLMKV